MRVAMTTKRGILGMKRKDAITFIGFRQQIGEKNVIKVSQKIKLDLLYTFQKTSEVFWKPFSDEKK